MTIKGENMPKYKIVFDISNLLTQFISDAYCEVVGFNLLEVIVTTTKTLTSTEIANIKKRLPFVEITQEN